MKKIASIAIAICMALGAVAVVDAAAPQAASAYPSCTGLAAQPTAKTAYGIKSETVCNPGAGYTVLETCNYVYAEYPAGHWAWIINGSGCNSNGELLDFGPCQSGTWIYATRLVYYNYYTGNHVTTFGSPGSHTC